MDTAKACLIAAVILGSLGLFWSMLSLMVGLILLPRFGLVGGCAVACVPHYYDIKQFLATVVVKKNHRSNHLQSK